MSSLTQRKKYYYSKLSVRVGDRKLGKKKVVYIKLDTDKYAFGEGGDVFIVRDLCFIKL